MNIGYSSKLLSDVGVIQEKTHESIMPCKYRLSTDNIYNKNGCLKLVGSYGSRGISSSVNSKVVAPKQQLTDVSSYLSNRHLKHTSLKKGRINLGGVNKYPLYNDNVCASNGYTSNSRMTHPTSSYREIAVNRFYNPLRDPQRNLDPPRGINTANEAKDNWVPKLPVSMKTINRQTTIPIYPSSE
jgi:hypothetical protein